MRTFLSLACALFATAAAMSWSTTASAQPTQSELPKADRDRCNKVGPDGQPLLLRPGDEGYRHACLHQYYKQLYDAGKCHCHTGYCRPTRIRYVAGISEVLISGVWYEFPREALKRKAEVPPELWEHEAHVCAHPLGGTDEKGRPKVNIECVMENAAG